MIVSVVLAVLLIAGDFFFVAAEFAITRARPAEVTEVDEARVTQLRFPADPGNSPAR